MLSLELKGNVRAREYIDLGIIEREIEMKAMGLDKISSKVTEHFKEQKRFRQI